MDGEDQLDQLCKKIKEYNRTSRWYGVPTYRVKRKINWIGHILFRNYVLKHVSEGKVEGRIEVTGRIG